MKVRVFFKHAVNTRGDGVKPEIVGDLDAQAGIVWAGRWVEKRDAKGTVAKTWELLGYGVHLTSGNVVHDMDVIGVRELEQQERAREAQAKRMEEEAQVAAKKAKKAEEEAAAKKAEAERLRGKAA